MLFTYYSLYPTVVAIVIKKNALDKYYSNLLYSNILCYIYHEYSFSSKYPYFINLKL